MPLYFNLIGTIADVDQTTSDSRYHPALVVLLESDAKIERLVVPPSVWTGPRDLLKPGRRLRVAGECGFPPKPGALPVAFHVEFVDVH